MESAPGSSQGLGLLEMETTLETEKQLCNVQGRLLLEDVALNGYEIHAGVTKGAALMRPLVQLDGRNDGAISADGQVIGTYLHGLFESKPACDALLRWAGLAKPETIDYQMRREADIDRLADAMEQHLDMAQLEAILGLNAKTKVSCA